MGRVSKARRTVMALAVGVIGCGVVSTVVSPAEGSSAWAPGPTLAARWSPTYMGGRVSSTTDVAGIARRFDVLAVQSGTFSATQVTTMKETNPRLRILVYVNGSFAPSNAGPGTAAGYPESMYALDVNGTHPTSVGWGSWLMKMWQAPWRQDRAQTCSAVVQRNPGSDGCFLDMLGVAPIHGDYLTALPVNDSGGLWTDSTWLAATSGLAKHVAQQNPGLVVMGNGLGNGRYYFTMGSSALLNAADGLMAEVWLRGPYDGVTAYRTEAAWKSDVDMLVDAGNKGSTVFTTVKLWVENTAAQAKAWHKYTLATFLLGTNGRHYYNFSAAKDFNGMINAQPSYDNVDVGQPVVDASNMPVSYSKGSGGCYGRPFTRGMAVVNPTNATCTVTLPPGTFKDLDGLSRSGTVTLAAKTGEVYQLTEPPTTTSTTTSTTTTTTSTTTTTTTTTSTTTTTITTTTTTTSTTTTTPTKSKGRKHR